MKPVFRKLRFPLLGKELVETAARRRTYIIRVVYALLLFLAFALFYKDLLATYNPGYSNYAGIGAGGQLFKMTVAVQFVGIYLFLPALMSGTITREKERDSLVLLFLTDLRPWEIVLEKYLAALVPMFSFLLLATPLAALAYTFGGVSMDDFGVCLLQLFLCCLQLGAIALMCSAYCRNTVGSFLLTYVVGAIFYFAPVLSVMGYEHSHPNMQYKAEIAFAMFPPYLAMRGDVFRGACLRSIPVLISIAIFLFLARHFLTRRAFAPPRHRMLRAFKAIDGFMTRLNCMFGGVKLVKEANQLPGDKPIAWREVTKKPIGQARYLARILVIALAIVVVVDLVALGGDLRSAGGLMLVCFWLIAVIFLTSNGANAIVGERVNQTLEVLLTTTLEARNIVLQKAGALVRLMVVFALPILVMHWLIVYTGFGWGDPLVQRRGAYMVCALLSLTIYLPLLSWLSVWIGLRSRTRFRAIVAALAVVVAWCVVPPLLCMAFNWRWDYGHLSLGAVVNFLSPVGVMVFNEGDFNLTMSVTGVTTPVNEWFVILCNFSFYGILLFLIRSHCLRNADRYLRRA